MSNSNDSAPRRLLGVALLALALSACSLGNETPIETEDQTNNADSIIVTEVEMRGRTYDCIVYDRKSGYAGMGGIWCERRIG